MFGEQIDEAERRVNEWQAAIEARAAEGQRLSAELQAMRGEGADAQGWVRVTVDHGGRLLTLDISERVKAWPMRRIADAVLAASRTAHENVVARAREVIAQAGLTDDQDGLGGQPHR